MRFVGVKDECNNLAYLVHRRKLLAIGELGPIEITDTVSNLGNNDLAFAAFVNRPLDDLLEWARTQPWAIAMRRCEQDAGWHSEGDVWTHTVLVCRELERVDGWDDLKLIEQLKLYFAALLHYSAKPLTTIVDPESGRVRSPKHAVKGEQLARGVLRDLQCPFHVREEICGLVRHHGRPVFINRKEKMDFELARLSWLVRHDRLYTLAVADFRGRDAKESNRGEDDLDWYKAMAIENNCFTTPYPLANDKAKFLLGQHTLTNLHYEPFEDYRCQVTMMSGVPGCGKDTWLNQNRPELPVVSLDQIRRQLGVSPEANQGTVIATARERCRKFLRSSTSFAFNATNTTRQIRKLWIDLFAQYDARIEIVAVENTTSETLAQNRNRTSPVPDSVILRLIERSEPVHALEAHQIQHVLSERLQPKSESQDEY